MLLKLMPKVSVFLSNFVKINNANCVRLLYNKVWWLSKVNCLKRFMEFFEFSDILSDIPEMEYLLTINKKTFVRFLADIFEKLNVLN